jgi:hypothetical protein
VRGRTAEAALDVDECLALCECAAGATSAVDLAVVAMMLDRAGRAEVALVLAEKALANARGPAPAGSWTPMLVYGRLMLQHRRPAQAVAVLREAYAAAAWWSEARLRASAMLFQALAAAGRIEELEEHAQRDLLLIASNAWGNVPGRRLYIEVLELLECHQVGSRPALAATIAKQRRTLLRQQRRRWVLAATFAVLTGHRDQVPERPRATWPADPDRAAVLARLARAEAGVTRSPPGPKPTISTVPTDSPTLRMRELSTGTQPRTYLRVRRATLRVAPTRTDLERPTPQPDDPIGAIARPDWPRGSWHARIADPGESG